MIKIHNQNNALKSFAEKISNMDTINGSKNSKTILKEKLIINLMKKFILVSVILLIPFIFSFCKKNNSNSLDPQPVPDWYSKVDSLIKQSKAVSGAPAAIVGVFQYNEDPVIYNIGHSDIESLTKVEMDMKFRIASNTKTFTAQTVLLLAEEGLINLDKHLLDYLPECSIQYADTITIRQMLNMTSGIANYNAQPAFVDVWNSDPLIPWSTDDIIGIINNVDPDFFPGYGWNYSDSNYYLLGLIIESVTEKNIEDVIAERILTPLGLENTLFAVTPDMPNDYCTGYKLNESGLLTECSRISPSGPWAAGAMISDVYDFGNWAKVLGTGSLLSENMRNQCFDFVAVSDNMSYGLGLLEINGLRGHTGMIQGYETVMFYSPEKDVAVVVMLNKCNEDQHSQPAVSLCFSVFEIVCPELF